MKTRGRFDWTNLLGVRESIKQIRRPFLQIKKNIIINYAIKNGVFWIFDNTNADNNFLRNKTRNLVLSRNKKKALLLSILHKYSKCKFYLFKRRVKQLRRRIILRDDRWIVLKKNYFLKLNSNSKKIFLQTILKKYNDDKYLILKNSKWNELWNYLNKNKNLKDFILSDNIFITNSRDLVVIRYDKGYEKKMLLDNDTIWDDYMFKVTKDTCINKKQEKFNNKDNVFIDRSLFSKGLFLRNWRTGDSYLDIKNNKKRVSKLFLKNKFNNYQKMSHPIMVDANDNIVWVPGLTIVHSTINLSAKNNCIKISKEILN